MEDLKKKTTTHTTHYSTGNVKLLFSKTKAKVTPISLVSRKAEQYSHSSEQAICHFCENIMFVILFIDLS